jgi:hypothetical protein
MTAPTRRPITEAAPRDTWMKYGRCRETDPDLFFPEGRGGAVTTALKQAKKVCGTCPVRALCLDWAVTTGQTAGVWGGLDEDERLPLRREHVDQRTSAYARCIDAQDLIERRAAEGKSHRQIGDELGVCHSAVGRAWRYFQTEAQNETAQEVTV